MTLRTKTFVLDAAGDYSIELITDNTMEEVANNKFFPRSEIKKITMIKNNPKAAAFETGKEFIISDKPYYTGGSYQILDMGITFDASKMNGRSSYVYYESKSDDMMFEITSKDEIYYSTSSGVNDVKATIHFRFDFTRYTKGALTERIYKSSSFNYGPVKRSPYLSDFDVNYLVDKNANLVAYNPDNKENTNIVTFHLFNTLKDARDFNYDKIIWDYYYETKEPLKSGVFDMDKLIPEANLIQLFKNVNSKATGTTVFWSVAGGGHPDARKRVIKEVQIPKRGSFYRRSEITVTKGQEDLVYELVNADPGFVTYIKSAIAFPNHSNKRHSLNNLTPVSPDQSSFTINTEKLHKEFLRVSKIEGVALNKPSIYFDLWLTFETRYKNDKFPLMKDAAWVKDQPSRFIPAPPKATLFSMTETEAKMLSLTGGSLWLANRSIPKIVVNGIEGGLGKVKSLTINYNGDTIVKPLTGSETSYTLTLPTIKSSIKGPQKLSVYVSDEYGSPSNASFINYDVEEYKGLTSAINAKREQTGTSAIVSAAGAINTLGGTNSIVSATIGWGIESPIENTRSVPITMRQNSYLTTPTPPIVITGLSEEATYKVEIKVTDKLGNISSQTVSLGSLKPLLYIDPVISSIGVGKYPSSKDRFEVGNEAAFDLGALFKRSISLPGEINTTPDMVFPKTTGGVGFDELSVKGSKMTLNDQLIPTIQSGIAGGVGVQEAPGYFRYIGEVKFDKPFLTTPKVVVNPKTSVPGRIVLGQSVSNVTKEGFTVYIYRVNTTNTNVDWLAFGY